MTVNIERHRIDPSYVADEVATWRTRFDSALQDASRSAANLSSVVESGIGYAGYLAVLEPASSELVRVVRLIARSGAYMLAPGAGEDELEVRLDADHVMRHRATGPTSLTDVDVWLTATAAAVVAREVKAMEMLVAVPTSVLRCASTTGPECAYLFVDALRAFYLGRPSADLLMAALNATDPDTHDLHDIDYTLNITFSQMQLLLRLMTSDRDAFNRDLATALKRHRIYYGRPESRSRDPKGLIALGSLAFAAIVHDSGWPIEVESDYLPKRLLEGEHAHSGSR